MTDTESAAQREMQDAFAGARQAVGDATNQQAVTPSSDAPEPAPSTPMVPEDYQSTPETETVLRQKKADLDATGSSPWSGAQAVGTSADGGTIYKLGDGTQKIVRGNNILDPGAQPPAATNVDWNGAQPIGPSGEVEGGTVYQFKDGSKRIVKGSSVLPYEGGAAQPPAVPVVKAGEVPDSRSPENPDDLSGKWRAAKGANPNAFDGIIKAKAKKYGLEPNLLKRLVETESGFDPKNESGVGAQGLGQLMPDTAAALGVDDPLDPEQNLEGTAKYLSQLVKKFGGRKDLALAAYNAGPGAVEKSGRDLEKLYAAQEKRSGKSETRGYVPSILGTPPKTAPQPTPAAAAPAAKQPVAAPHTPHDQGALDALTGGFNGAAADVSTPGGQDAALTASAHPVAAAAGHLLGKAKGVAELVAGSANPGAAVIAAYPKQSAAAGLRVLAAPVGVVDPESAGDMRLTADQLAPPAGAQKTPAAPAAPANEQPGKPSDAPESAAPAPGTPAPGASAPSPVPLAPPPPTGPDEFEQQRQKEDAAVKATADAEAAQNDAVSAQANKNMDDRQALADQTKLAESARQAEGVRRQRDIDDLNDQISNTKINPDDRSTGQKIMGSIGLFLGGIGAAKGAPSHAAQIIHDTIDRAIDAQKANLVNRRAGLAGKETAFANYFKLSGDARAAEVGARAEMLDFAKQKLDAAAQQSSNPLVRAKAQAASAQISGDILKNQHAWADTQSQIRMRNSEVTTQELTRGGMVMDQAARQQAMNSGMPLGAKMGEVIPISLSGEAAPRHTYGSEGNKRVQAAYVGTRGTLDAVDQMKDVVSKNPWESLVSGWGPHSTLKLAAERAISQLFLARGQTGTQPNEVIQKALLDNGLMPGMFTSTKSYLDRLEQFKRSVTKEGNDVISTGTIEAKPYFPEGPNDFQPGALRK